MTTRIRRARFGASVAVALGALALLALPALSAAEHGSDDASRHSNGKENAGTVASYDAESGVLAIDLKAGGTATALVTDETRIRCVGVKRGGHRHHQHRGRGRGHEGEDSATSSDRAGKKARRGGTCTDAALSEGAVIRKARTDSEDGEDLFTKVLVEQPKTDCDEESDDRVGEDSSSDDRSDDDHSDDDDSTDDDDDGTPDQGPGDV